jgi:hypothetical protein
MQSTLTIISILTKYGRNFNDTASFKKYGGMNLADWRRLNVNNFVNTVRFQSKLSNHGFNLVSAHLAFGATNQ